MNMICRCGPRHSTRLFASDAARTPRTKASDPTGTMPIQRRFSKDLDRRWSALRRMVPTIVSTRTDAINTITHAAMTGQDTVRAFQSWFDTALRTLVVEEGAWMMRYVREAGDAALLRAGGPATRDRIPPLQTLCHTELQGIAEAVSQQAVRAYANGLLTRQSPAAIARAIQQMIDKTGRDRGALLVSFIVVRAFGAVTLDAYRANGISHVGTVPERISPRARQSGGLVRDAKSKKGKTKKVDLSLVEVLTAGDDDVCPACEDISEQGPYTLDEAEMLIPAHPRCVLPGTVVEGSVIAAMRSQYSGPAVSLTTRSGSLLRVTTKHPVLTARGWIDAGKLVKGDKILSKCTDVGGTFSAQVDSNDYHPPSKIEKIFDSLWLRGFCSVKPSGEDLHGDARFVDGDVDIVFTDRRLLRDYEATFAKSTNERVLEFADHVLGNSVSDCTSATLVDGDVATSRGLVSSDGLLVTLDASHFGPLQELRFGTSSHWNVVKPEFSFESPAADANLYRTLSKRYAAEIQLDEIIDVEHFTYHGHVYDLQTATGYMVAQGVVISNCRCAFVPAHDARFAHDSTTHIAAGVMFLAPDGRALFVKRSSTGDHAGEWCFPGGAVEPGETVEQAAVREAHEEVGIGNGSVPLILEQVDRRELNDVDFTTYLCHVAMFTPTLNDEHTAHAWRRLDDPPEPLHPGVRATVNAAVVGDEFNEALHPRDKDGKFATIAEKFKLALNKAGIPVDKHNDYPDQDVILIQSHFEHQASLHAADHPDITATKIPGATMYKMPKQATSAFDPEPAPAPLDMKNLVKVSGKKGSNEGGVYASHEHADKQYYIKTPKTKDHVQNELTAAALYKVAGVNTMEYVPVKGGDHVATVLQPLDKNNIAHFNADERHEAQKDFAVHAWLANWDAAGTGGDNQVIVGGKVHTVDTGGSLKYRAQGEPKGMGFGTVVHEINTLRDPASAPDAAALYGNMTNAQIKESIARVTAIPNSTINEIVYAHGGDAEMVSKLIARKNDLAKQAIKLTVTAEPTPLEKHEAELKTFKTKTEHIKHLLLQGTTSEEVKSKMGWKQVSMPQQAAATGLMLEITKKNGVNYYKGTPLAAEDVAALKKKPFAPVVVPTSATPKPDPLSPDELKKKYGETIFSSTPATQAELDKAKKNTKLTAQYVPGAPAGHPEAEKLIAAFNAKYEGKEDHLKSHEALVAKVNDFKKLQADMIPLMSAQQQEQAAAVAKSNAEAAAKNAALQAAVKAKKDAEAKAEEAKLADPVYKAHIKALEGIGFDKTQLHYAQKVIDAHNLKITAAEGTAIQAYVGSSYSSVNEALRKGSKMSLKQIMYAQTLNDALQKMPIYQGEVVRGLDGSLFEHYANNVGSVVTEQAFTSAGIQQKLWGDMTLHITSLRARDIRAFNPHEGGGEVVFRKGSHFHIIKVDPKTKEVWMEEI